MITFNDKKILIIDDESEITFLLQNSFEADGYQVVAANTGVDGIIEARRFNPNIMIIDITMPDLNGYKVIQILREEMNIPMILLSARHTEKDKVYGLGIGANDFVAKPFSISELKARVIAHLRSFERISKNEGVLSKQTLKFDKMSINFNEQMIYYDCIRQLKNL